MTHCHGIRRMIRRRLHGLSRCISYNMNVFHNKTRNEKNFRKQYRVMEEIGRGGFGIVYKGERTDDGAPVAIKFIEHRNVRDWTTHCKQLLPTEICLLELCKGTPGVVRLVDWFTSSKGFMIVMDRPEEFMDLYDIISLYGSLDESIARMLFRQLVDAVCNMYRSHNVLHRDIKDENVIVNMETGEAFFVDFGAATVLSKCSVKRFQGTPSYCPPECIKRRVYMPLEATVWSLGILLFVMVTGNLPFANEIQICLGRFHLPKGVSKECEELIRKCLNVTPERRTNLAEVRTHRWLCQPDKLRSESLKISLERCLRQRSALKDRQQIRCSGRASVSLMLPDGTSEILALRSIPRGNSRQHRTADVRRLMSDVSNATTEKKIAPMADQRIVDVKLQPFDETGYSRELSRYENGMSDEEDNNDETFYTLSSVSDKYPFISDFMITHAISEEVSCELNSEYYSTRELFDKNDNECSSLVFADILHDAVNEETDIENCSPFDKIVQH